MRVLVLLGLMCVATTVHGQSQPQRADGQSQAPNITAPPPVQQPLRVALDVVLGPNPSSVVVNGLEYVSSDNAYRVIVTASEDSSVFCRVTAGPKAMPVFVAEGTDWVAKGQTFPITAKISYGPPARPDTFDIGCQSRRLSSPAEPIVRDAVLASSVQSFELKPEPPTVTTRTTNDPWKPTFALTASGSLALVLDDAEPGMARRYATQSAGSGTEVTLSDPVNISNLTEGKYYRYHFEGTAGTQTLAQTGKTYVLTKDTVPRLAGDLSLTSQSDGVHARLVTTRKSTLQLRFPNPTIALNPKDVAQSGSSTTYEFVIPTTIQQAGAVANGTGVLAALKDATQPGAAMSGAGSLTLTVVDLDRSSAQVAVLNLTVVDVAAAAKTTELVKQLEKSGDAKLNTTQATAAANQILGIDPQKPLTQEQKDAAQALISILQKNGGSAGFKKNLISFLVLSAKAVATSYGIPIS